MTKTDVWNRSLIELGRRSIDNIETNISKEAKTGNAIFIPSLNQLLRKHPWGFARKEVALALVTGATSVEYDYVYAQPADCLKIRNVFRALSKSDPVAYEKRANANKDSIEILTDEEDAVLVYTATVTNFNMIDENFIDALVYYLASKAAKTLTGDSNLKGEMLVMFEKAWAEATRSDNQELIDKYSSVPAAEAARNA